MYILYIHVRLMIGKYRQKKSGLFREPETAIDPTTIFQR